MKLIWRNFKVGFLSYILFSSFESFGTLIYLYFFGQIIDVAIKGDFNLFWIYSLISISTTMIAIASGYFSNIFKIKILKKINLILRTEYYNKIFLENFNENIDTGEFINSTSNKIMQLEENYYESIFIVSGSVIFFTLSLGLIIWYSWIIFLITTFFSLVVFAIPFLTKKKANKKVDIANKENARFLQISKDGVKSYWNYWSLNKTYKLKDDLLQSSIKYDKVDEKRKIFEEFQTALSTTFVFVINLFLIILTSYFLLEGKYGFNVAIVITLSQVTGNYIQVFNTIITFCIRILNLKNVNKEFVYSSLKNSKQIQLISDLNSIEFKNFNYSYNDKLVLENLNLKINQGDKVWIKGSSGKGKTTLLKQLFYPINFNDSSDILINNNKIKDYDIRNLATYINQDIFLNNDTIWNNITLANPKIEKEKIENFVKILKLDSLIKSSVNGYETMVLDNMKNLSGGERQRLAILRGLANENKWLFIDEINSSLDKNTSKEIMNYLLSNPELTIVMVAHNLDQDSASKVNKVLNL